MQEPTAALFARVASALAAPSRLRLMDRLCQGEQTVEELAAAAGLGISNTSRQLRQLAESGLAVARREPPFVYYRVANEQVVRFWFELRDLARRQLAEVDRIVRAFEEDEPGLEPMTREELLARLRTGEVVVLDVRPATEYRAGHIPGARSVPREELEAQLATIPPDRAVVAYCRGPYCMLAVDAVRALRQRGFHARRLAEGLPEWRAAGLPASVRKGG